MAKQVLMRSQLVIAALRTVRARRGDGVADDLRRRFELPPSVETDAHVVLSVPAHRDLMTEASELVGDPLFGIHLARGGGRDLYGLLSFAARTAPTLREALGRVVRFVRLANDTVDVRFTEEPAGGGTLRHRVEGEPLCLGRHDNEFFVTLIVEEARRLTGGVASPERIWFAHAEPEGVRLSEELGVADVRFEAGENGVFYSSRALAARMTTFDPALLAYLDGQAEAALGEVESSRSVLARTRAAVRQRLDTAGGDPTAWTVEAVAKALGMSGRSLQRRLADEGTSYQEVLDGVREAVARSAVDEGRVPLGELAHRLGYAGLRPFLRAFKRWTALTPTQYRERSTEK